jgi:predicted nucleotidyltransferase
MQTTPSALLPILRSRTLTDLLAYLFVHEPVKTISELAEAVAAAPSTVKREIDHLEAAGLVRTARVGRNRPVTVNTQSPLYPELRALFLKAFGPPAVLREELGDVPGVEAAFIFGSWARRHEGAAGPLPRDVDVLVVGDVDPDAIYMACAEAERRLRVPVNPTLVTEEEWAASSSPFLETLRHEPLVEVRPN